MEEQGEYYKDPYYTYNKGIKPIKREQAPSASGFKWVYLSSGGKLYEFKFRFEGKTIRQGKFKSREEAYNAVLRRRQELGI